MFSLLLIEFVFAAQLTVYSKSMFVNDENWIPISEGTFSQSTCKKGEICRTLRVKVNDATWTANDSSIVEIIPAKGSTVTIKPLKEGQYIITISANNISTIISGRVFDKGETFVMTLMAEEK